MIFETINGEKVDLIAPRTDQINMDSVAHHLAMICRYNGAVKFFYSVAEHSTILAKYILDRYGDAELALCFLLHDAGEYVTPDVSAIYKHLVDKLNKIEANVRDAVLVKNKIDSVYHSSKSEMIDLYDKRIREDERRVLRPHASADVYNPIGVIICGLSPTEAKNNFLCLYYMLQTKIEAADAA